MEKPAIRRIAAHYKIDMQERPAPTDAEVSDVVAERLTILLEARLRERDKLQAERSRRFTPLAHALVENEDELPVIIMLLDDYYQQLLHAPVARPDDEPLSQKASSSNRQRRGGSRRRRR